jgi:hypothetical protein
MESPTPTPEGPPAKLSPANEQARLRRERREAKIKAGGASRLQAITSLNGGQTPSVPAPTQAAAGKPRRHPKFLRPSATHTTLQLRHPHHHDPNPPPSTKTPKKSTYRNTTTRPKPNHAFPHLAPNQTPSASMGPTHPPSQPQAGTTTKTR